MRLHPDDIKEIAKQVIDGLLAEKKARRPRNAKGEGYTEAFEAIWSIYPKRPGNNKREAYECFNKRLQEGVQAAHLYDRVKAYAAHCESAGKSGEYILQARTFFGCNHRFNDDWPIIEKKKDDSPEYKVPAQNENLKDWAEKYGYSKARPGEQYSDWRRRLNNEVELRSVGSV